MKHLTQGLIVLLVFVLTINISWAKSDINETIASISAKMSEKIQATGKKKVAVVNFTNTQGEETALGKFIAEEFSVELAIIAKGFSVVDRSRVNFLLKENGLTASGLVNPKAASQLGKLSSIDALIIGSFTPYGENLRVNVKVLDLQTADILTAARGLLARTNAIDELRTTQLVSSAAPSAEEKGSLNSSRSEKPKMLAANGLSFTVDKCVRKSNRVNCTLIVKAIEHDNIITVYGNYGVTKTVVYDDVGSAKVPSMVDIGGDKNKRFVKRTLVAGVSNKLKLQFDGVSTAAQKVTLLRIKYHSSNNNQSDIAEFRDVVLQ